MARQGKRVLLVDADPQGDLTTCLGWQNQDNLPATMATLMEQAIQEEPVDIQTALLHHREGVDLLPSNIELSAMEMALVTAMSREFTLKEVLSQARNRYDYILIDCMPSLGRWSPVETVQRRPSRQARQVTINALATADSVIIPVQAHYLPAKGMTQLLRTIGKVKRQINPNLRVDGVLLTLVDNRTNLARQTAETLRENYGSVLHIYHSQIPLAVKAAETSAAGKSIYAYDPTSKVAMAYESFTKEVLDGEKQRVQSKPALTR